MPEPVEFLPRGTLAYEAARFRIAWWIAIGPPLSPIVRRLNDWLIRAGWPKRWQ